MAPLRVQLLNPEEIDNGVPMVADEQLQDMEAMEAEPELQIEKIPHPNKLQLNQIQDQIADAGPRRSVRKRKYTNEYKAWKGIPNEDYAGKTNNDILLLEKILTNMFLFSFKALSLSEEAFTDLVLHHEPSKPFQPVSALLIEPYVPINYKDAISCPDSQKWKAGIDDEYASIMENKTWSVVPLPEGRKPIKCKWILDYKPLHKGAEAR